MKWVDSEESDPQGHASRRRKQVASTALAMAIFALATGALFSPLIASDARRFVPSNNQKSAALPTIVHSDVIFHVGLVARNARALVTRPERFFESEHCAPFANSLTFGIPMITMVVLGLPAH